MHRCILSIPLHYDSYIAIFIISAIHRCWRDRGSTRVSSSRAFSSLRLLHFLRFALSLFYSLSLTRPPLARPEYTRPSIVSGGLAVRTFDGTVALIVEDDAIRSMWAAVLPNKSPFLLLLLLLLLLLPSTSSVRRLW